MKPIRNSCKAVIVQGGKLLLTKNRDQFGEAYLFPGGGQEHSEPLSEAVYRECLEELGAEVIVKDIIHIREYIGRNHEFAEWDSDYHQVEFYFECELKNPTVKLEGGAVPDPNQIGIEWVALEELEDIRLYPGKLGRIIRDHIQANVYIGDVN